MTMMQTKGGSEILESLGYTEYTGFALQFPRNIIPDMFAGGPNYTADDELFGKFLTLAFSRNMMTLTFSDHIGNLTVELILASAEVPFNKITFCQSKIVDDIMTIRLKWQFKKA